MTTTFKHVLTTIAVLGLGAAAAFALFVGTGVYNFAADEPHTAAVHALLETMRDRSIETRAAGLQAPDLSEPKRIVQGAGNYNAMCVGCHLAPGMAGSELSKGLYPAPPNLSKEKVEPAQAFWVIKHGIKASGMPAWGKSMSDEYVWNMAAFLQELPELDADGYKEMVARSGGHHHDHGGHDEDADHDAHEHGSEAGPHDHEKAEAHAMAEPTEASMSAPSGHARDVGTSKSAVTMHTHADGTQHMHNAPGARK
jgi:mono/diheme cytochrome c family protein